MAERADYYTIRFSADPVQLIFFRHGLARWLEGLRWPEDARVDAILAISEVCTNAVQHAYPSGTDGDVEVVGRLVVEGESRHLSVVVRDWGSGALRATHRTGRGYGLTTVQSCMERVSVRHTGTGTVVSMRSRSVPLERPDPVAPAPRRSNENGAQLLPPPRLRRV